MCILFILIVYVYIMAVAVETSPQEILNHSNYSIQNRRFGKVMHEESLHPNEDASCAGSFMDWNMYAVFDGHDGLNAVQFFKEELPRHIRDKPPSKEVLETAFKEADKSFFASLEQPMRDRNAIIKKLKVLFTDSMYFTLKCYYTYIGMHGITNQLSICRDSIPMKHTSSIPKKFVSFKSSMPLYVGEQQLLLC